MLFIQCGKIDLFKETLKMIKNNPILYLVVPCYNEQEAIKDNSLIMLNKVLELESKKIISKNSKVLFVNDGSNDNTEAILIELVKKNKKFAVVSFVSNAGHQNAIYAGMMVAKDYADVVVTIDADLQQDINALGQFIDLYKKGNDVVFGVRNDRSSDKVFKKLTASFYYKLMRFMGSNVIENSADYRLLSKKALTVLSDYKETNLFLRGLIPSMGLDSDIVHFDCKDRTQGVSKYTFKKMFNLAISGITSFSTTPIHLICALGGLLVGISLLSVLINLICLCSGSDATYFGWLISLAVGLFGVTIGSIGIVGEYVGTTNQEAKNRPRYIIDYTIINNKK